MQYCDCRKKTCSNVCANVALEFRRFYGWKRVTFLRCLLWKGNFTLCQIPLLELWQAWQVFLFPTFSFLKIFFVILFHVWCFSLKWWACVKRWEVEKKPFPTELTVCEQFSFSCFVVFYCRDDDGSLRVHLILHVGMRKDLGCVYYVVLLYLNLTKDLLNFQTKHSIKRRFIQYFFYFFAWFIYWGISPPCFLTIDIPTLSFLSTQH